MSIALRIVFNLYLLLSVFVALPDENFAAEQQRPNILWIVADDLGYGDLSCYGATDMRTPVLDQLSEEGMRFTEFYANCPVCSPTRASLLSGCYPDRVGVPGVIRTHPENSWGYLDPNATLITHQLKRQGYQTALIGKWHLGLTAPGRPNDRGFDHFQGWLGDMMDDYYAHRRHDINYMRLNETTIDPEGHATDLFSEWAVDYLNNQKEADEPFFLYLAYNAPHTPIQPPAEWVAKVQQREPGIDEKRAMLVALIEHMDAGIGQVLQALNETEQDKETLVFFTSDNGGQLNVGANNGPLRDGKQSMYEGGLKVPAIARWPGKIPAGTKSGLVAMTMDLFPTALELNGQARSEEIDGISILPTILGKEQSPLRDELYFTRREGGVTYGGKTIEALRLHDWKLVQNSPFGPLELFNLKTDPQETTDLRETHPQQFRDLAARLRKQIQRGGEVPWQGPDKNVE
ncbi:Arylsulfatase [Polystyrenella longa]|uniref:Arylsulfatase n=1 Tax=Polystyrenella longa TaxID=2528007 RepID=A0A518CS78_9PLAN|nr:sulfatase-like hydrolase/transferase [Polystyrenella longa]QDU82070.1 Arylsulfatase [Polystyrenella longa]